MEFSVPLIHFTYTFERTPLNSTVFFSVEKVLIVLLNSKKVLNLRSTHISFLATWKVLIFPILMLKAKFVEIYQAFLPFNDSKLQNKASNLDCEYDLLHDDVCDVIGPVCLDPGALEVGH